MTNEYDHLKDGIELALRIYSASCGADELELKKAAYYAAQTYRVKEAKLFAPLKVEGDTATGKSRLLESAKAICYEPQSMSAEGISAPALKSKLSECYEGTAIIEEGDDLKEDSGCESALMMRFDRNIAFWRKMEPTKAGKWVEQVYPLFGATIIHRRYPFGDPALESRAIPLRTKKNKERSPVSYHDPISRDSGLAKMIREEFSVPLLNLPRRVTSPSNLHLEARVIDAYKPLLILAEVVHDITFLEYLWAEVELVSRILRDGQSFEVGALILRGFIAEMAKSDSLDFKSPVQVALIRPRLLRDFGRSVSSHQISATLRKFGFRDSNISGYPHYWPDPTILEQACETTGINDETVQKALKSLKDGR